MRLRNDKKLNTPEKEENELLDKISETDDSNELEGDQEFEKSYLISKNSPYDKPKQKLKELKDSITKKQTTRQRKTTGLSSSPKSKSSRKPEKTVSQVQKSKETKSNVKVESSSFKILILTIFIILFIIGIGLFYYFNRTSYLKELFERATYEDVIKEYKNDLPGYSSAIISAAIYKYYEIDTKPIVLLLYGPNETKIEQFYTKLAIALVRKSEIGVKNTIHKMNNFNNFSTFMENNFKESEVAFLDGLERMKSKNYLELYRFVDEEDSTFKKGLIVISLHGEINNSKIDFKNYDEMENNVRIILRNLWNDIDVSNLEAFLNRIISFVAFVA